MTFVTLWAGGLPEFVDGEMVDWPEDLDRQFGETLRRLINSDSKQRPTCRVRAQITTMREETLNVTIVT
jgi:hypothetical protein